MGESPWIWGRQHQTSFYPWTQSIHDRGINIWQRAGSNIIVNTFRPVILWSSTFLYGIITSELVIVLIHDGGDRLTWPYQRRRRTRKICVISTKLSLCQKSNLFSIDDVDKSVAFCNHRSSLRRYQLTQVSVICTAAQTQQEKTSPFSERCLEVKIGSNFLDFPKATEHLMMASLQPPPAPIISPRQQKEGTII